MLEFRKEQPIDHRINLPLGPPSHELSLLEILRAIKRRKILFLAPFVVLAAAYSASIYLLEPRYTGELMMVLRERQMVPINGEMLLQTSGVSEAAIKTETAILESRVIAERTISNLLSDDLRLLSKQEDRSEMIATFQKHLRVQWPEKTYVVLISFSAREPQLAAKLANETARQYMSLREEMRDKSVNSSLDFVNRKLSDAGERFRQQYLMSRSSQFAIFSDSGVEAAVVSPAVPPTRPSFPPKLLMAAVAFAIAAISAVCLVLCVEWSSDSRGTGQS